MIVPVSVLQKHKYIRPYLEGLGRHVRDVVVGYCDRKGYAYAGRTKSSESLAEKIETGRYAKWSDLDDLFACTIVIPTLSDEAEVLEFLRKAFTEDRLRRRGSTLKDPAVFRFDTTRFIGRLGPSEIERNPVLTAIKFEVQVRTAFEHAWSVTTHALTYKAGQVNWRHLRLTAQLRSAIEQLDQLVFGFEQVAEFIAEQEWPDIQALQAIQVRFHQHVQAGRVPQEVVPESWTRFCGNLYRVILSGVDRRPRDAGGRLRLVNTALDAIDAEIAESGGVSFPRSISLLQFSLGSLTKRHVLTSALQGYVPLVTDELLNLFPNSGVLGERFNLEVSV